MVFQIKLLVRFGLTLSARNVGERSTLTKRLYLQHIRRNIRTGARVGGQMQQPQNGMEAMRMGQIKARYVAQIEADFEFEDSECELSLGEIRDNVTNKITPELQDHLQNDLIDAFGKATVTVTQMYADAWRKDDETD